MIRALHGVVRALHGRLVLPARDVRVAERRGRHGRKRIGQGGRIPDIQRPGVRPGSRDFAMARGGRPSEGPPAPLSRWPAARKVRIGRRTGQDRRQFVGGDGSRVPWRPGAARPRRRRPGVAGQQAAGPQAGGPYGQGLPPADAPGRRTDAGRGPFGWWFRVSGPAGQDRRRDRGAQQHPGLRGGPGRQARTAPPDAYADQARHQDRDEQPGHHRRVTEQGLGRAEDARLRCGAARRRPRRGPAPGLAWPEPSRERR